MVYLALAEIGKYWFYRLYHAPASPAPRSRGHGYRVPRGAARFTAAAPQGRISSLERTSATAVPGLVRACWQPGTRPLLAGLRRSPCYWAVVRSLGGEGHGYCRA